MKSPVASLCFVCSSVMNLESVMISVTICSPPVAGLPLVDMLLGIVVAAKWYKNWIFFSMAEESQASEVS